MGQLATAFKDPNPEFTTKRNVKNTTIESMLNDLYGAEKSRADWNQSVNTDFAQRYGNEYGANAKRAGQEIGTLDQFYNGGMEGKLAAIRNARRQAYTNATARAVADINRNRSIGFLGGDTPNNSYGNRIALGQSKDAEIALGLDDANQQKADLNYLTGNQINLAGRRTSIGDSLLQRLLTPENLFNAENARRQASLGQLNNIDKSNTFYGLSENKGAIDQVGTFLDGIAQVASIVMSKGANNPQQQQQQNNQWSQGGSVPNTGYYGMNTGGNYDSERGGYSNNSNNFNTGGNYDSENSQFGGLSG